MDNMVSPTMLRLAQALVDAQGGNKAFTASALKSAASKKFPGKGMSDLASKWIEKRQGLNDFSSGVSIGQLGNLMLGAAKAHPFKTLGLGALGAGNIGGLFDNDKIGGQIGGAVLGGLGSTLFSGMGPYGKAMMALGGGELGSLFDKLMAQKEEENQYSQY